MVELDLVFKLNKTAEPSFAVFFVFRFLNLLGDLPYLNS
jgi:hypothetical protein